MERLAVLPRRTKALDGRLQASHTSPQPSHTCGAWLKVWQALGVCWPLHCGLGRGLFTHPHTHHVP